MIDHYCEPGSKWYFEYHCWESPKSSDAELWYRSHTQVTVLHCVNEDDFGGMTFDERCEAATQLVYRVRFPDGFEGDVFEDELLTSEKFYERPDPPKRI